MSDPKTKKYFCEQILGVTPQAMAKIEHRLTMVKVKGKKILRVDLHGKNTLQYLSERDIKIKEAEPEKPEPVTKKKRPPSNNPSGLKKPDDPGDDNQDTETETSLKKKKIRLSNEKLKLEIDQKRSNLIEKNLTDIFFGKMYQIDADQLKQLGNNLSPKLFGIINERNKIKCNSILKILETDDNETKESIESILNSGEKEIKTKMVGVFEDAVHLILKSIKDDIDHFLDLLEADAI